MSTLLVERIGHRGDGIVRDGNEVLHVPRVLPGEHIEVAAKKLVRIITPSPDRIAPFCMHFDACGGCKFQHWREEPYRDWKRSLVVDALNRNGLQPHVAPLIDAHGEGRRRVTFHVRQVRGQWRAGFMEQKSHDLCAIIACPVLAPALRQSPAIAASFGPILGNCDVALTAADNGLDVAVKGERHAVQRRIGALGNLLNEMKLARLSVNGEIHAMREQPVVKIGKAVVPLPVQSFLQATRAGEEALVNLVISAMPKVQHVADLFCGLGTFSLRIAERCRVTAIDSDKAAVESLGLAIRRTQGLKPLAAEVRNLFNAPLVAAELNAFDCVVLDPPRAGAEAQVKQLARSSVKNVIYVSCDAQSFARDAAILCASGFTLKAVTPVDQFKWTAHVELVGAFSASDDQIEAIWERKDAPAY